MFKLIYMKDPPRIDIFFEAVNNKNIICDTTRNSALNFQIGFTQRLHYIDKCKQFSEWIKARMAFGWAQMAPLMEPKAAAFRRS